MKQSRRNFIKVTSVASVSILPAIKALAEALPNNFDNLIDGNFNQALEFRLVDINLLNLSFYFINVVKQKKQLVAGPKDRSYMIVRLPQMHLSENGSWDTSNFDDPVANLSGFSYLAFELWPDLAADKKTMPFSIDTFLDWNNPVNLELITLVEWLKIKKPEFPYFTFEEYVGSEDTFFRDKSFTDNDIQKITHGHLPQSVIFAKYHGLIRKFFKLPISASLPEDVEFVPVTLLEIPQGLLTVPLYRTPDGSALGAANGEKVEKKFWPNVYYAQQPGLAPYLKYEVWSNSLFLKRQAEQQKNGAASNFHFEVPGLRVVGLLPEKNFVYKKRGVNCADQVNDDKAAQILPSLLDKTELAYLLQYAKNGANDFTGKANDLHILEGLIFSGLGTITHLSYSNRNCPAGIDLIEYEHRISQGRDVFEKVSRLGYNSKTGQPYKHTIEGQRTIALANFPDRKNAPAAYVHFEQYCECLDTTVVYDDQTLTVDHFNKIPAIVGAESLLQPAFADDFSALRHPFQSLDISEKVRIPIDCLHDKVIDRVIDQLECLDWFWPLVKADQNFTDGVFDHGKGKTDKEIPISAYLSCDYTALDRDKNPVNALTPFMFIRKSCIEAGDFSKVYANYYQGVYTYPDELQDTFVERRRTYYNSQKIAYTSSAGNPANENQAFDSKVNQIETHYTETYFRIRKFAAAEIAAIAKTPHILYPQLLQAEVFLDHIRDLAQTKIPSYIEYHRAYLDGQFDDAKNHGAQILAHTEGFIRSLAAPANDAASKLSRSRDQLMNAMQEAKDKLGNLVIPDIQPETVSLKSFGITLPKTPDFTTLTSGKFLDPKKLLPGPFSEILGGLDLKQILNELLPEAETPVFQLVKQAADLSADLEQSPLYQTIKNDLDTIKTEIQRLQLAYTNLLTEINTKKDQINQGLKIIANGIPNAEQVKNYLNKQYEYYKIQAFDLALENVPVDQVKSAIEGQLADAKGFMTDQVSFIQTQVKRFQQQTLDLIANIKDLLSQFSQADLDQLPSELLQIGGFPVKDYLASCLTPAVTEATNTGMSYQAKLQHIYATVSDNLSLKGPNGIAIKYDPATYILSATTGIDVPVFAAGDLATVGYAQLEVKLNFFKLLIAKNSNGTAYQLAGVVQLQNFFDGTKAGNYITPYQKIKVALEQFQTTVAGPMLQNINSWKNTYDAFDQAAISLTGRAQLTKLHDYLLKTFPWIDTLQQLDPWFYYQQSLRLKKDATDIALRFKQDLSDAYQQVVGDAALIKAAAKQYRDALHQLSLNPAQTGPFMTSVNQASAALDALSLSVFNKIPGYSDAKAQLLKLYGDAAHSGLVQQVQDLQGKYAQAYQDFNNYVRQNEGKLTESLNQLITEAIARHPEEVALAEQARNIYQLLNAVKQQDLTYTWSTTGFRDVNLGIIAFKSYSNPPTRLAVNVRATTYFTPGKFPPAVAKVETYSENVLSNFGVSVFSIFTIIFSEVSFVAGSGQSTHFDVKIREVQFDGALAFVQKFEEFLKTMDAGLLLDIESDHVALGYALPIPSIQTPGFAFFNLTLQFDFRLYFDKRPMSLGFSFATAENKFGIAVYIFAGFGFFSIVAEPKRGIVSIDAALEAGVWAGFSLGPISGTVKLAFGFRYTRGDFGTRLEGYIVAEGRLTIWIIEVSARIYLGIVSQNSSAEGSCTVTYSIKLGFFKKSFSGTFYKKISGAATNHQQQAQALHQNNIAQARRLQLHIRQAPPEVQHRLNALDNHLTQVQRPAFAANFINKAAVTGDLSYITETYAVSQQDWDDFFDRFN